MKRRTHIHPISRKTAEEVGLQSLFNIENQQFERMLEDDCVLEARVAGSTTAIAGLNLADRSILGPLALTGSKARFMHLLVAIERLAISYGLLTLNACPGRDMIGFFSDSGYSGDPDSPHGQSKSLMSRSIIRRSTKFSRRTRRIGIELGIPDDFGARHRLRLQPEAESLVSIGTDIFGRQQKMVPSAAESWKKMVTAATGAGVTIQAVSAYRSVDYQADLVRRKLDKGQSIKQILSVSAAPGYSEHHSGNAIDITTPDYDVLEEVFEKSPAFEWLTRNAADFGFRLSYPRNNRHGVAYEPWHWCWRKF